MFDGLILPLQAVAVLFPLAVVWIGGGCATYYIGGQSLRTYGEKTKYEWLRPIGRAVQEGAVFTLLYFLGLVVLVVATPLEPTSELLGPIVYYSAVFAPGVPIVFAFVTYSISTVSGRESHH